MRSIKIVVLGAGGVGKSALVKKKKKSFFLGLLDNKRRLEYSLPL